MTFANEHDELMRVAAYGLVFDNEGRMLVTRIAPGYTRDADGMWTLPGGGLNFGEDPADGAVRELEEETGLTGEVTSLAFVNSFVRGAIPSAGLAPFHSLRIVYRMRVTEGTLRHETDESTDMAAWFTLDELRTLPIVDLVEAALDHLKDDNVAIANRS
jgi:8-oxo-dGTP diphosphatase